MARIEGRAELVAVSIGGQAPTLAPADADFRPTHPAITWLDQRPSDEADRMYARLGEPVLGKAAFPPFNDLSRR